MAIETRDPGHDGAPGRVSSAPRGTAPSPPPLAMEELQHATTAEAAARHRRLSNGAYALAAAEASGGADPATVWQQGRYQRDHLEHLGQKPSRSPSPPPRRAAHELRSLSAGHQASDHRHGHHHPEPQEHGQGTEPGHGQQAATQHVIKRPWTAEEDAVLLEVCVRPSG